MSSRFWSIRNLLIALALILLDLASYIFIGLLLMNYEDFYDESQGEYWSWESMDATDKSAYISWHIWVLLNLFLLLYLIYRTYRYFKFGQDKPSAPLQ